VHHCSAELVGVESPHLVFGANSIGAGDLLRVAQCLAHKGTCIATLIGRALFVAIALLVVTVGVLATESRLPNARQNTASWHTSKLSRMEECGGRESEPAPSGVSQPPPLSLTVDRKPHFALVESPLPELAGVPQAHGLRAPPVSSPFPTYCMCAVPA